MPPAWTGTQEHLPLPKYKVVFQGHTAAGCYLPCLSWPMYSLEGPPKRETERFPADRRTLCCRIRAGSWGQAHISNWESNEQKGFIGIGLHFPGAVCPKLFCQRMSRPWAGLVASPSSPHKHIVKTRDSHTRWFEQTPALGGLQPLLRCSCSNSGTRYHPQYPMSSCLAQEDSGALLIPQ